MRAPGRLTGSLTAVALAVAGAAFALGLPGLASYFKGVPHHAEAASSNRLLATVVGPLGPTPTPIGLQGLTRVTEPGCCALAGWMPESSAVLVIARSDPDAAASLMAVPLAGGPRRLVWDEPAVLSPDGSLVLQPSGDRVRLTRISDGEWWTIYTARREPRLSPSGTQLAWDVVSRGISHPDVREHALWVSDVTGARARKVVTIIGGGLVGWGESGTALIATGRVTSNGQEGIWAVGLDGSAPRLLHQVVRPREPLLSPGGTWVAFHVALSGDSGQNGLWVMRTDGTSLSKVTPYGAYRWRRDGVLLLIPLGDGLAPMLFEVDAGVGRSRQLTDPIRTALPIANNDWVVSPDGRRVAFTSWIDRALWVLTLPEP